jgi:outer membrane protein TolC
MIFAAAMPAALFAQPAAGSAGRFTLDAALAQARKANAELPVARLQVQGAEARVRQARGALYPKLSLDGDLHGGTPQSYASSDALFRVLTRTPIYDGGELRAGLARSNAEADAFRAGYRVAVRDVDYAVRVAYGLVLRAQATLTFRRRAVQRLQSYLAVVQARRAAGQGVGADVLQTQQRLASARADIATVRRDLHEGKMTLNDLLGRFPGAPLSLAPLPEPAPLQPASGQPWLQTPDIAQSEADVRASRADLAAARAGHKPHLDLEANVGTQPVLGSDVALLNNGTGSGAEVLLSFSMPFWDKGVYQGRLAEATAALGQARQQKVVVQRSARLAWTKAASDVGDLFTEYRARNTAAGVARDAYLQAESLYRGGQSTALTVLDAYDAWIQADQAQLNVIYDYRVAQAELARWGTQ